MKLFCIKKRHKNGNTFAISLIKNKIIFFFVVFHLSFFFLGAKWWDCLDCHIPHHNFFLCIFFVSWFDEFHISMKGTQLIQWNADELSKYILLVFFFLFVYMSLYAILFYFVEYFGFYLICISGRMRVEGWIMRFHVECERINHLIFPYVTGELTVYYVQNI